MIVGFSRHGTGSGGGPVGYVTDKTRTGREDSPPEVLRGSPEATRNLIDSLDFRHKYTSGVLSFAPEEKITSEMEQEFMDRFEQVAFAGLEADQYSILWVRHTHAGHHELHFVTPRVELSTGKSLNIRPPGDAAKQAFDDLRSEINARYGLADPDDPRRTREVAQPDHELKIAAEALRRGEKPQEDVRLLIDAVLSQRAAQGLIRSRGDVIDQVSDLGMEVTREGKNYITVSDPQSGQRWRMKGGLYEREFDAAGAIEAAASRRERDYSKPDEAAAEQFARRVERHISARAEYHAARYAPAAARHDRGYAPEPAEHVADHLEKPGDIPGPEHGYDLGRYLSERLGPEYVSGKPDHGQLAADQQPESHVIGAREQNSGPEHRSGEERDVRRAAQRGESGRQQLDSREAASPEDREVKHDGAGNAFIERIETYGAAVQRAAESIREGAVRLAEHVRAYCGRQRHAVEASQLLRQSGECVIRAAEAVREPLQAEQALRKQLEFQEALQQKQREPEAPAPKQNRYYGPSM